jgi:hypothetical protein
MGIFTPPKKSFSLARTIYVTNGILLIIKIRCSYGELFIF